MYNVTKQYIQNIYKSEELKTIIVGLGNPSFSDDGVGLLVARAIKRKIPVVDATVVEATIAGLDVLDIIANFEKAIIIDAIQTPQGAPGSIYRFEINQVSSLIEVSPHSINLLTSLKLGKKLGLTLPEEVIVFGIEAQNVDDLSEECTPLVKAAIPFCVGKIMTELTYNRN